MDSLKNYGSDSDSWDECEEAISEDTIGKLPGGTSDKTSGGTSDKTSGEKTDKISGETSDKICVETTHKVSEKIAHKVCEGTTHDIPEDTILELPESRADKTPGETTDKISGETTDKTSGETTDKTSGETTDKISGETTDKTSGETTDKTSGETTGKTSGETTDKISGETSDKISGETTDKISGETSNKISGETTDKISGETSDKISGETTDKISEKLTKTLDEATHTHSPLSDNIQSEKQKNTPDTKKNVHRKEILDSSEQSSNTLHFNFLGLEKPSNMKSDDFRGSQTLGEQSEIRKVQTNWGEVEIPNGDFWTDFQPDPTYINSTHKLDYSGCHTMQTDKTFVSKSCVTGINSHLLQPYNSLQSYNPQPSQNILQSPNSCTSQNASQLQNLSKRANHSSNSSSNTEVGFNKRTRPSDQSSGLSYSCQHPESDHTPQKPRLAYSSKDPHTNQNLHKELQINSLQSQPIANEKRKIFYVHSKVAPHVNITPTNKCASRRHISWPAHDGVINRLAWNIPSFSHLLATAGMDTSVKVWNVWSSLDLCVARLSSHKKAVKHVEWCHTGRTVLSCSYDRTAQVTDLETGKVLGKYEHMGFVTAGHIHPSNPNLFVTGTDNLIVKWDMRTPQAPVKHFSYKDKFGQVQDLLFINNGQEFVSCSDLVSRDCADRTVMVWDFRVGTVLSNQIYQEMYVCTRLKIHPNTSTFLAQSHAGYVALFSTAPPYKMDKSKRYEGHKVEGHSIGFDISPDGTLVYSGSAGNDVHCYHQNSSRLLQKLSSKNDIITDVACHPVLPSCLASCTWGGSVSLWM